MPRAILFDFDGVIADTEWLHSETFRRVLAEERIPITDRDHSERFLGVNDRAGFIKAFAELGREPDAKQVLALVERKSAYYRERLGEIPLFPGAADLIRALSARRPLAIASGGRGAEINAVLGAHGIREWFLAVLSADEIPRSKPAPDSYLIACETVRRLDPARAAGLKPEECLVIEDSVLGVGAAKAAGMYCVAVEHTYPREKLLEADRIVPTIADLRAEDLV